MNVFYSWHNAKKRALKGIRSGKVRTLTTDVFDTLLLRTLSPEALTEASCTMFSRKHGIPIEEVKDARNQAWSMVTAASVAAGFDHDGDCNDFFLTWVRLLLGHKADEEVLRSLYLDVLKDELDLEACSLVQNAEMVELLTIARKHNVQVVAISDMYLDGPSVRQLLSVHGFNDLISDVITSGSYKLQKRTGRLFQRLIDEKKIVQNSTLHIGDDAVADGIMPTRFGINSLVVHNYDQMLHRFEGQLSGAPGYCRQAIIASSSKSGGAAYNLGRSQFGSIYSGFVHGIIEHLSQDQIDSLWFMAREGQLLQELFEIGCRELTEKPVPSCYLYTSRLASLRCQFVKLDIESIQSILANTPNWTVANLLKPLLLSPEQVEGIYSRNSVSGDTICSDRVIDKLLMDEELQRLVEDIGHVEREGFKAYLSSIGFPKIGRVGVVDVGWGGQIQENFTKALRLVGYETEVVGYYIATDDRAELRKGRGNAMRSLYASPGSVRPGRGAFRFVHALELATRAPHGSVIGYAKSGQPILADDNDKGRLKEMVDDPKIASIQQGVADFASEYFKWIGLLGLKPNITLAEGGVYLDRLALLPDPGEAAVLLNIDNVANMGMDEGFKLGSRPRLLKPSSFVRTIRSSLWKEGTVEVTLPYFGAIILFIKRHMSATVRSDIDSPPLNLTKRTKMIDTLISKDTFALKRERGDRGVFPSAKTPYETMRKRILFRVVRWGTSQENGDVSVPLRKLAWKLFKQHPRIQQLKYTIKRRR